MKSSTLIIQMLLAFLFTHELDAISQSEWRLLYVLRDLSHDRGRWWFVAIHVPLFWVLIAITHHSNANSQRKSRTVVAIFSIVHALLHIRLRDDPLSSFNTPLSWVLIVGCAAWGVLYLFVERLHSTNLHRNARLN